MASEFIEFSVSQDVKVKQDLGHILNQNLEKLILDICDKILEEAIENLRRNENWVTGNLARSGFTKFDKATLEGFVIFSAPYAAALEYGSKPHIAPLGPSLPVTIGKRGGAKLQKRSVKTGKYETILGIPYKEKIKMVGTPDPSINPFDYWAWRKGKRKIINCGTYLGSWKGYHTALGWGVWKKIQKVGTIPHPYLRPAVEHVRAFFGFFAKKYKFEIVK
jgi:hypothetical protein